MSWNNHIQRDTFPYSKHKAELMGGAQQEAHPGWKDSGII